MFSVTLQPLFLINNIVDLSIVDIIRIVKNNLMLINILIVQNKIQNTFGHGPSSVDIICKYKRENPHKIAKEKYLSIALANNFLPPSV